jgi:transcriptional regulator with XRE-family HTH domain
MEWWEIYRTRRRALYKSATKYGQEFKISISRISDIEKGKHKNPSLNTLRKLAAN